MKDIKTCLSQELTDHTKNDARMLTYFIQTDYISFLCEDMFRDLPEDVLEDHIMYLIEFAEKGDREQVRNTVSHLVFDYFPEFNEMFPSWWKSV